MSKQEISALMDGELPPEASSVAVDALARDRELKAAWRRYHLIGDAMRETASTRKVVSASTQVSEIAPHRAAPQIRRRPPHLIGLALAAGVATIAVILLLRTPDGTPSSANAIVENNSIAAPSPVNPVVSIRPAAIPLEVSENDQRLNSYLVNFNEQRARYGAPSVHPYVRIVGFEPK
jgi:sigma-E factor negative regulatory protein RseA